MTTSREKLQTRLYFFLLFFTCILETNEILNCRNNSVLKFPFGSKPKEQTESSFSICREHRYSTCCNTNHTNTIVRKVYPYFEFDNFSYECRNFGLQVECSLCDSRINTGVFDGLCENLCNSWYQSCLGTYFFTNKRNHLAPCEPDSLVCFRLRDLTTSGRDFCEKSGHRVVPPLVQNCYNGNAIPPPRAKRRDMPSQVEKVWEDFWWNFKHLKPWQQGFMAFGFFIIIFLPIHALATCCLQCCETRIEVPFSEADLRKAIHASKRAAERKKLIAAGLDQAEIEYTLIKKFQQPPPTNENLNKKHSLFNSNTTYTASSLTAEEKQKQLKKIKKFNFSESLLKEKKIGMSEFSNINSNFMETEEQQNETNEISSEDVEPIIT